MDDTIDLDATFEVDAGRVVVTSAGQEIGHWRADEVDLSHRRDGILLTVNEESLLVRPVDRYGFSDAVEAARTETPKRRLRRRRKKEAKNPPVPVAVEVKAQPGPDSAGPAPARSRRAPLPPVEPPQPGMWPFEGRDPVEHPATAEIEEATAEPSARPLADAIESAKANPLPRRFSEEETKHAVDLTEEIFGEIRTEPEKGPKLRERLVARWRSVPDRTKQMALGLAIGVLVTLLVPEVVATVLVLAGLAACLVGGAGMADPNYTRKLPAALSEVRLLIGGGVMLVVGFLIGLPSV